uniref:Putative methyltransferase n=1 Tax=viral metagenome TaxID=1070528 RepID=A0A6M3K9W2_9ZZZZ
MRPPHIQYLKDHFPLEFPLWEVLHNNALASYTFDRRSSCSVKGRADVQRFKDFLSIHMQGGPTLDVGSGPWWPAYAPRENTTLLDPLFDTTKPKQVQAVYRPGVAENMPFLDGAFQNIICATSLDHVCHLPTALDEIHRVLAPHGQFFIWCCDRTGQQPMHGYVEINEHFYYVPPGAVDPFHTYFESLSDILVALESADFKLHETVRHSTNEIFLRCGK